VGTDAQFFGELGYKDAATAADTARALVILRSDGKETGSDFEANKAFLRQCSVLPDGWLDKAKPTDPTEKGNLARLVSKALGIKGGIWMHLFGPTPRLALSECAYLELMQIGCEYCHVSGGELVGVIDRCDRWRDKQEGREPPKLKAAPAPAREEKK
jgi:hypothetical protein